MSLKKNPFIGGASRKNTLTSGEKRFFNQKTCLKKKKKAPAATGRWLKKKLKISIIVEKTHF